jgi:hypothetical protein
MNLPDNEADYGDHEPEPGLEVEELSAEALVWQLLLLINPGDEETALRQFSHYRENMAEDEEGEPIEAIREAIDWASGFYIDWKDTPTFIDCVNQLAARWNLEIDWGGDAADDDFVDATDIPALMATAYDRLREYGYTLWTWDTGSDSYGGWIASSRDDEAMRLLAAALQIELRAGSDSF